MFSHEPALLDLRGIFLLPELEEQGWAILQRRRANSPGLRAPRHAP